MPSRKLALFSCVVCFCFAACAAWAQQNVPPPKPADNGPTLADTMKFIQDKMNNQGRIQYDEIGEKGNPGESWGEQISGVIADPSSCTFKANTNPRSPFNGPAVSRVTGRNILLPEDGYRTAFAPFKDITVISVQSAVEWYRAIGKTWVADVRPPVFVLTIKAEEGSFKTNWILSDNYVKTIGKRWAREYQEESVATLSFVIRDEDLANRIAKAMVHAVELCGGGRSKPEPF
jgi:hypothetical protein